MFTTIKIAMIRLLILSMALVFGVGCTSQSATNIEAEDAPNSWEVSKLLVNSKLSSEPVYMLNMVRYKDEAGKASYQAYLEAARPIGEKLGAELTMVGSPGELIFGEIDNDWDLIFVVKYPSREIFLELVSSDAYKSIFHLRKNALEESVLLAISNDITGFY